ncbi:MAG: glycoside hydrolase family 5 protein [Lachnospiraceae bacterium]|nr:glycoside hydrolase family 5 protein [Lachnospiraceae bacterium]
MNRRLSILLIAVLLFTVVGGQNTLWAKPSNKTPVSIHGRLKVKGANLVDKKEKTFMLKGFSTHGINWFEQYVNQNAFRDLKKMGINCIRLAMYTSDYNGYCSGGNKAHLEEVIDRGVKACKAEGMYVIIDWHILNDSNPNTNIEDAKVFFHKVSAKYKKYNNVIYEICNEPNGSTTWEDIKKYANTIINVIRENDKKAVIIVGTPNWSQRIDDAANSPIKGQKNIMYALHFYAATHKYDLRKLILETRKKGLPVIISECNISEASGSGLIDVAEGKKWFKVIKKYKLSCIAWSFCNKDETSALVKPNISKTKGFTKKNLSKTGKFFVKMFN